VINRNDPRPAYQQVSAALRDRIRRGELVPGGKLPSTQELESEFDVSPTTVQRALRTLKGEGLIIGRVGTGVYVREQPQTVQLASTYITRGEGDVWPTWATIAQEAGMAGTQDITQVGTAPAPRDVANRLGVEGGAQVVVRRRILSLDGEPVQLADSYYPPDLVDGSPITRPGKLPGGTQAALERLGVRFKDAEDELRARVATPDEATRLRLANGAVVFDMLRTTFDANDRPVEVQHAILTAERHILSWRLPITT
jgi:GntR family transcriptional regulator